MPAIRELASDLPWARLRMAVWRGYFVMIFQTPDNVGRKVSRQHLGSIGLVATLTLLVLHGAAPFRRQRGSPDPSHGHRRAIGCELQLVFLAVVVRRCTG